jgi:hypothetical protein
MTQDTLERGVAELRGAIQANDGANVATPSFVDQVERLLETFYDEIGTAKTWSLADVLDLFIIKVLYVNRRSRDAATITYLARMMERYLRTDELLAGASPTGNPIPYLSDLLEEAEHPSGRFASYFEACRKSGDNALFVSGLFPGSLGRKRASGRLGGAPHVDQAYVGEVGRRFYEMAAHEATAEWIHLRATLLRLAKYFDVYAEALHEVGERYVLGIDMSIVANKMLDALNRYKETGAEADMDIVRTYGALLRLDRGSLEAAVQPKSGAPKLDYF